MPSFLNVTFLYFSSAEISTTGTGLVVCAVKGEPSVSRSLSALPWSAVRSALPPIERILSTTFFTHSSTACTALTAAGITPVCPTMSQLAKLRIIASYVPVESSSSALSVTSYALISGFKSYVATLGELMRTRTSFSLGASTPPLKKNVTCAYFSVSAMWSCFLPIAARYSPSVLCILCLGNAISTFV